MMKPWLKAAALGMLGILGVMMLVPAVSSSLKKRRLLQQSQNARSIHIATLSLMNDGLPGDLKTRGVIKTVGDFAEILVRDGGLKPNDLRVFAGPGFKPYEGKLGADGHLSPPFADENCAYWVYLVKDSDPGNAVFLESKPVRGKGTVVVRKGGDVSMYRTPSVANRNPENCLNP